MKIFYKFSQFIFIALMLILPVVCVSAQTDASDSGRSINKEDFPKGIKESLAKSRIDREKKEYEELIQNGEEAAKLSEDLEKNFSVSNKISTDDQKKLDRLEKLAKKIRHELGANESEDFYEDPKISSLSEAFKALQSNTDKLVDALKTTTRYSVSVVAIQSSNAFLKVVKFIRVAKD